MIEATNKDLETENSLFSNSAKSETPAFTYERVLANPYLHMALLLFIVGVCFGRTLSSYFLADDFGEVSYVSRIFNGEPQLFWSNFTGNYMQIPGMNVYRPWLLVSLVADFVLYKANALGYYFTNLSYFTGVVWLIYFVARQLTAGWSKTRSATAAFFGAALFAANPLRCESVSWVVGRVDIICCFFYLTSYLLFLKGRERGASTQLKSRRTIFTALGVLAFFLAMGTKEMAIGLPVLLAVTAFFGFDKAGVQPSRSFMDRVRDAALFSAPLWVSAAVYFVIRYICLGTLGGGYVAGFGASQLSFMVQRWLDPDTIKRLFFPFSSSLFNGQTVYGEILTLFYGAVAGLTLIRLAERKISLSWFLFLTGWLITAAVPIFQLWGLGFDLEGSRFYFFLSIPLCLMAPILLFRPVTAKHSAAELKLLVATAVTLTGIGCTLGRVAALTDLEWVHAGKENKQVSVASQKLAESEKQTVLIPVLGIPKERSGAHQILNGSTFGTMLSSPFTSINFAQRFATFDPIMFGPPEYINASRFKSVLRDSHGEFFVWNSPAANYERLTVNASAAPIGELALPISASVAGWLPNAHGRAIYGVDNGVVRITSMQDGDSVRIGGLSVNPVTADFLEFEYRAKDVPVGAQFKVFGQGNGKSSERSAATGRESSAEVPMSSADNFKIARVRLSRYWNWFCQGDINALTVQPYPCSKIEMKDFKLLSADTVCPSLALVNAKCDGAGIYRTDAAKVLLAINAQKVVGVDGFEIEIGKVNYFFNNFEKVDGASPVQSTVRADINAPSVFIDAKEFSTPGFYEVRARCVNKDGKPIGEYSDTLTLRITPPSHAAVAE